MPGPAAESDVGEPWRRWSAALLLLAAPKCLLCLAAYAGLGTMLGTGAPEFCGAVAASGGWWLPLTVGAVLAGWQIRPGRRGFKCRGSRPAPSER